MFGDPPAFVARVAIDDQRRDALRLVEIEALTGRLEGGHQRFREMHVRVLAAIRAHRRPVGIVFFRGRAGGLVPEPVLEDLRHVREQARRVGMAHAHRGRGREQDEGVAVGLFRRVGRLLVVHPPEIAAVLAVAHPLPQERHTMIDNAVGARKPEQMCDGEGMHHARGSGRLPVRPFVSGLWRQRPRVLIQREEPARRIERGKLEEVEQGAGVVDEPEPVGRQRRETRRPGYGKVSLLPHHMAPSWQSKTRSLQAGRGADETGRQITRWCRCMAEDRFGASREARLRRARLLRLRADQAVWDFLAAGPLAAKTPVCEGWKSLDFLGFSRPKRAFSMRYTGFSLKKNSRAPLARGAAARDGSERSWHCEAQDWSWGELALSSDFLQEIVAPIVSFEPPRFNAP